MTAPRAVLFQKKRMWRRASGAPFSPRGAPSHHVPPPPPPASRLTRPVFVVAEHEPAQRQRGRRLRGGASGRVRAVRRLAARAAFDLGSRSFFRPFGRSSPPSPDRRALDGRRTRTRTHTHHGAGGWRPARAPRHATPRNSRRRVAAEHTHGDARHDAMRPEGFQTIHARRDVMRRATATRSAVAATRAHLTVLYD